MTTTTPRPSPLLTAPILPTLLRLSAPNLVLIGAQSAVSIAETYFVGRLGTDALAGVSIVFPLVMLLQMMSAGAMGGGISSAVARARGASRHDDARALAWHAVLIALALGLVTTVLVLALGPLLYASLGGRDASLAAALAYSNVVFGGATFLWLMNSLASVLRGTGDMRTPARVMVTGALLVIPASPLLIYGWGPIPSFGLAGAAGALVAYYVGGTLALGLRLLRGTAAMRLERHRAERRHFVDILRVGVPACIHAALVNTAVAVTTGFVGAFGTAALAGYGIGSRLEYLQIPIVFGMGAALVAMVGTNVGAGQLARARRIAWTSGLLAAGVCGTIGVLAALLPFAWAGLFTSDPAVLAVTATYLRIAGPAYVFLGLGMALYFAFQGTGRMLWPLFCVSLRIAVIVAGSVLAMRGLSLGLASLFVVIGVSLAAFGAAYALVTAKTFAR